MMMSVVGMTAVGFLVCLAVAKAVDVIAASWFTGSVRRPKHAKRASYR